MSMSNLIKNSFFDLLYQIVDNVDNRPIPNLIKNRFLIYCIKFVVDKQKFSVIIPYVSKKQKKQPYLRARMK